MAQLNWLIDVYWYLSFQLKPETETLILWYRISKEQKRSKFC